LAIGLLAAMATVQVLSVRLESQTWDEGFEIASGYSYLKTGDYRISPEHPPLARVLAALPLLWLNLDLPVQHPSWAARNDVEFGHQFIFGNRVPADRIVFLARLPTIVTTVVFGLILALWTRRVFGSAAALGSPLLFTFDPNIIANGRYVKNDMLVSMMGFLTVAVWGEFLRSGKRRWLVATGVAFGIAMATKFSALFLLPVLLLCWFVARWQRREPMAPVRGALALAAVAAIAVVPVLLVYAPESNMLIPATRAYREAHPEVRRLGNAMSVVTMRATVFMQACTKLGLQDHPLLVGFTRFLDHTSDGHDAYLLGRLSKDGWWYYFPVAFAVKTPVATLAAIALAAWLGVRRLLSESLRTIRMEWFLLIAPIAVYAPLCAFNRVDIGLRHLLPIYPFIFILTAAVLARTNWRGKIPATAALAAMLVIESVSIYPNYLAFFNVAAGGPGAGPRYLVDSNIDWGQDLLKLRDDWIARGRPKLCTLYFGSALPEYYGLSTNKVPRTGQIAEREAVDCVAAVSVTPLEDVYMQPGDMAWLRERKPIAKIGYSIYLYDLRKR
jgi:4-amino-4-deoxy-L-arabinose transferase-like glycosyltransferase